MAPQYSLRRGVLRFLLALGPILVSPFVACPTSLAGQAEHQGPGLSVELGLGASKAGQGGGYAGKAALRFHLASGAWAFGVRGVATDGARRKTTWCLFSPCEVSETVGETAALLYRIVSIANGRSALYLGAGMGRITGWQFIGSSSELEYVSELGMSFEAALHAPRSGFRVVLAANGQIGGREPLVGATIGLGFGR